MTAERVSLMQRVWPMLRVETRHLWLLIALAAAGMMVSLIPTEANDFWWHLKAGELIASSGIPSSNIFAWTLPADTPFVYQSWLGERLFYLLYQVGGLPLVIFGRNMLALALFVLVALETLRRSGSWKLAALAVLLLVWMMMNNVTTRTQNWSWVPFVLLYLLLSRYAAGELAPRWLLVLPVLLLFWVNAHGAFAIGLLLTGAFVVGETLRLLLRQPGALTRARLDWLSLAVVGMVAATLVNPLGPGVYAYVYQLLTDAPSQGFVIEWQPPSPRSIAGAGFFLSVLLLLFALAFGPRRPTISDMLVVAGFAWMAFNGVRYVPWFGIVALPLMAQLVTPPPPAPAPPSPSRRRLTSLHSINLALALGFGLALLLVQPWFKPLLPWPADYQADFAPLPDAPLLFSADTPVQATEYLRENPCTGHLFHEMGYGSYLIWALYPAEQVFVDPRVELYPLELWQDYIAISRGDKTGPLLDDYAVDCVLLGRKDQPNLSAALAALPNWERTFRNEQSEVWRRIR